MWSEEYERRAAEMRRRNERKQLTSGIGHDGVRITNNAPRTGAAEYHYTVKELGTLWNLSTATITRIFRDETGVLIIGSRQQRRGRRSYTTLRIPESVVERVYRRLVVQ